MSPARSQPEGSRTEVRLGARAHNVDSASTAPVKRYALEPFGPALRLTGHRSWRYITTSGRWEFDHLNNIDNVPNTRGA